VSFFIFYKLIIKYQFTTLHKKRKIKIKNQKKVSDILEKINFPE